MPQAGGGGLYRSDRRRPKGALWLRSPDAAALEMGLFNFTQIDIGLFLPVLRTRPCSVAAARLMTRVLVRPRHPSPFAAFLWSKAYRGGIYKTSIVCPEKQALTDLFIAAVRDIMALQDAEVQAAREGKSLEGFDLALNAARSKRDRIKRELLLHVQEHGVSSF